LHRIEQRVGVTLLPFVKKKIMTNTTTNQYDLNNIKEKDDANLWLYAGDIGFIIYVYYRGLYKENQKSLDSVEEMLSKQYDNVSKHTYNYKFGYGIPGFAWVVQFLINEQFLFKDESSNLDEIDALIERSLKWNLEDGLYDLFIGTIGKGLYFFERLSFSIENKESDKVALYKKILGKIVYNLEGHAVKSTNGIYWLDRYTSLYNDFREKEPFAGIGLSHGIPSIIYFLGKCYNFGIAPDKCKQLISNSINWLQAQESELNNFPTKVYEDGHQIRGVDLSWCYGLFSVASSFWIAGKVLEKKSLIEKATSIVDTAAEINIDTYAIHKIENNKNIFFCHGTAGISYLFSKFYQLTQVKKFQKRSKDWLKETDKEFLKYDKALLEKDEQSILDGFAGVDLVKMSLSSNSENTNWDKLFLLDLQEF